MQVPARYAAAIAILDDISAGVAVEPALLHWARRNRYAGSKDRAAIRDIVFSVERRRASCAAMGGGQSGRALVRGYLAQEGIAEDTVFGAGGYAPDANGDGDGLLRLWDDLHAATQSDLQPWVLEQLELDYGPKAAEIGAALRDRAPVWLRVNLARATRAQVMDALEADGFGPVASPLCQSAIELTQNIRKLAQSAVFNDGLVEPQDLSPQRALAALNVAPDARVLDYCAGGGGKSLALAARGAQVHAHDASPARMRDIPARAARAKASITTVTSPAPGEYDLVLCDVPCSGSGAWRRAVGGKWSLSPEDVANFVAKQRDILNSAARFVAPGGQLAYMTCSLFDPENGAQARDFGRSHRLMQEQQFTPLDQGRGDGFYLAVFDGF
ncbi:MAG: RsmB/NOP family class I SAM-dependent RNA methyltransferase [Pseudomonadota bacterium]